MVVKEPFAATRNACKLCAPLGACLALRGVAGAVPFLHGSQGCATYIRRYLISHFREPVDIAVSGFSEATTVFGGGDNLRNGLNNVARQYHPELIGIATTCLPETIGEDVGFLLHEFHPEAASRSALVHVSTPSYRGTHVDGFHATVKALVEQLAEGGPAGPGVNVFPGMVSPADLRYLKEVLADFGLAATLLPDYSETLDGPQLDEYQKIPAGGTPADSVRAMGRARVSLELGRTIAESGTAAASLESQFGVARRKLGWPVGVLESDRFFAALSELSGRPVPEKHVQERGRLVDSYVDAHKYVFGRRAVVYGEEDLVVGIAAFLAEIGSAAGAVRLGRRERAPGRSRKGGCGRCRGGRHGKGRDGLHHLGRGGTRTRSGFPDRQQQGLQRGPRTRYSLDSRRLPDPRPHRRPAHSAPRLPRRPTVVRRGDQYLAGPRAGPLAGGLQLSVREKR